MNPNQSPQMPQQQPAIRQGQSMQQFAQGAMGNKQPQMPQQSFTGSHHHIYDTLRNHLMDLVKMGVPGIEKVLTALNNSHIDGIKSQSHQSPQMPQMQQRAQGVSPQMAQGLMGNAAQFAQHQPTMPQGGR